MRQVFFLQYIMNKVWIEIQSNIT